MQEVKREGEGKDGGKNKKGHRNGSLDTLIKRGNQVIDIDWSEENKKEGRMGKF